MKAKKVTKKEAQKALKEIVLDAYKKGNLVIYTHEGIMTAPLKEVVKQPIDGLLYDLNRNESVILTFINDPKWVNDYALVQVLRYAFTENEKQAVHIKKLLHEIKKIKLEKRKRQSKLGGISI